MEYFSMEYLSRNYAEEKTRRNLTLDTYNSEADKIYVMAIYIFAWLAGWLVGWLALASFTRPSQAEPIAVRTSGGRLEFMEPTLSIEKTIRSLLWHLVRSRRGER